MAELPEHMIRIIAPDIGGGFGNKVPVYPGYVIAILASILLARPVKWIEDKTGNLISTGYARDMYFHGELALRKDGKIQAVRIHADTDNGAFFSDAQPTKFKIGLFHSTFGCYDIPYGHLTAQGHYTNKAPGGVAYRCSFRITESMLFQERFMQTCAYEIGMDQAEFRRRNFVREFPTARPSACFSTPATTTAASTWRWRRSTTKIPSPQGRGTPAGSPPRHRHLLHVRAPRRRQLP